MGAQAPAGRVLYRRIDEFLTPWRGLAKHLEGCTISVSLLNLGPQIFTVGSKVLR